MKIFKVILNNYRQYYGWNEIPLSTDSTKNMTILQGQNGEGKSNFMNAICWCLYGKEIFKSENETLPFLNSYAAKTADSSTPLETEVTLYLGKDKEELKFTRKITYSSDKRHYETNLSFIGWEISDKVGWEKINNPEWYIEKNILPKELVSFFFFDGEKMDEFFEDTKVIKPNVEKLAQIATLEGVSNTLTKVNAALWKEYSSFNKEKNNFPEDLSEYYEIKRKNEQEIKKLRLDNATATEEKDHIDLFLSENSSTIIKELVDKRRTLEDQRTIIIENLNKTSEEMNSLITSVYPLVYGYKALEITKELIDENTKKGVLPPNIKDQFVEELLQKGVCICGRPIDEDPNCRKKLEELLASIVPNDVASDSQTGRYILTKLLEKVNFVEKYSELHKKKYKFEKTKKMY